MKKNEIEYNKLTEILERKDFNIVNNKYQFNESTLKYIKTLIERYHADIHEHKNMSYEDWYIIYSDLYDNIMSNKQWKLAIDMNSFLKTKNLYITSHDDSNIHNTYGLIANEMMILSNIYNNWLFEVDLE